MVMTCLVNSNYGREGEEEEKGELPCPPSLAEGVESLQDDNVGSIPLPTS